jgi:DNA-binding NarL/FixJ family response regulator
VNAESGNTRVLVVSNDSLTRAGLATLLADSERFSVVGRVSGDIKLVEEIDIYRPDVILWDLGWERPANQPGAVAPLQALAETGVPVVVMLTNDASGLAAWSVGARGLLMRSASTEQIFAALEAALEGLITIDPALTQSLLVPPRPFDPEPEEALTPRELEVLRLIAEDQSSHRSPTGN